MTEQSGQSRSRALLVGTLACRDTRIAAMPGAAENLAGMRAVLTDADLCGWPGGVVVTCQDVSDVGDLSLTLRRLAREAEDVLLLYFTGPGIFPGPGELCLAVAGSRQDDAEDTSLRYTRVRQEVLASRARVKIVILDCSYSGQVIDGMPANPVAELGGIDGTYVLTSSDYQAGTAPAGEPGAGTPFTAALIGVIRSGDADGPACLTLDDLYQLLAARLRASGQPAPNRESAGAADRLPFALNAACDRRSPAASARFGPAAAEYLAVPRSSRPTRRRFVAIAGIAAGVSAVSATAAVGAFRGRALRTVLRGPADRVNGIAFSPDGRFLAGGSQDTNAWVWDMASVSEQGTRLPHGSPVYAVAFSPDSQALATASADGAVRLWDLAAMTLKKFSGRDYIIKHAFQAWGVAFSPDGKTMASSTSYWHPSSTSTGPAVAVYDASGTGEPAFLPHPQTVRPVAFSADGRTLVTGCNDCNVRLWDTAAGTQKATLAGHKGAVSCVSFRPGRAGSFATTGSWDRTILLWNLDSEHPAGTLGAGFFDSDLNSLAFSPDGNALATANGNSTYVRNAGRWSVSRTPGTGDVAYNKGATLMAVTSASSVLLRNLQ
jgi:WD domain, G-beta repeat